MLKKICCMVLASCLLLGGCGGQSSTKEGNSTEKSGKSDDTKITIMTAMAYGTEELDAVLKKFEDNNPGVTVEIQHYANDYEQACASRFNSGDIPDIFVQQTGSQAEKYADYAYDFTDDPIVSKFKESAINISKNTDGKLLSLPWTYESMGFIYDKKILDEVNVTEMPQTIDELEALCKKISDAGYTPFSAALKETWVLGHIAAHFFATENDDPKVTVEKLHNSELTFADMKEFKNIFPLLDMMVEYGPDKPLEVDWEISENRVVNSEAAMIHMGDWCEATLKDFNPDAEFGFMPVPVSNDGTKPTFLSSISWQFIVHKDAKNVEKAKELLEFMLTSDEGIEWMTQGVKAIPSAETTQVPDGILASAAQQYIDDNESLPWNHTFWPPDYNNKLGEEMQRYILKEATADEVLGNLMDRWE